MTEDYVTVDVFKLFRKEVLRILISLRKDSNLDAESDDDDKGVVPPKRNDEAMKADVRSPWDRTIRTPSSWAAPGGDGVSREHTVAKALGPDVGTRGDGTGPDFTFAPEGQGRVSEVRCPRCGRAFAAIDTEDFDEHLSDHTRSELQNTQGRIAKSFDAVMDGVDARARNRGMRAEIVKLKALVKEAPEPPQHLRELAERWHRLREGPPR